MNDVPHPALTDEPADYSDPVEGTGAFGMPDTVEDFEQEIASAEGPQDQVPLLDNLVEGTRYVRVRTRDGQTAWREHRAIYWREENVVPVYETQDGRKTKVGEQTKVTWTLFTHFSVTDVRRIRRYDTSLGWVQEYEIDLSGVGGNHTVTAKPEDLIKIRTAEPVFAPAGGFEAGGNNQRRGSAMGQLRTYLEFGPWSETKLTTDAIGRVPAELTDSAGLDPLFVFPDVSIDANGATDAVTFDAATYPNVARAHLRVAAPASTDDAAQLLRAYLAAARTADPSAGHYVLATALGWGTASAFASQLARHPLAGMSPVLYTDGTPGSGKSTFFPKVLALFGAHPADTSAGLKTAAQVRDKFTAVRDCGGWITDEVNVDYMSPSVRENFRETLKDATNFRSVVVGGRFASSNFRQRSLTTSPTLALLGERLPQMDPALMDRIVSVSMPRRDNLPADIAETTNVGMQQLAEIVAADTFPALSGTFYSWVLRADIDGFLRRAYDTDIDGIGRVTNRNQVAIRSLLAGLYALQSFAAELGGSQLSAEVDTLIGAWLGQGIDQLIARMDTLKSVGGAVAMLRSLAMLTHTAPGEASRGPVRGTHWQLVDGNGHPVVADDAPPAHAYVQINPSFVCSLLRVHKGALGHPVMEDNAFRDEIGQWAFTTAAGKKRPAGGGRAFSPVHWYSIELSGLEAEGGPGLDAWNTSAATLKASDYAEMF